MRALILIDLQNDFMPGGALAVPEGDEVVPVANRLADRFDLVVASQDWHPAGHGSFASSHPGKKPLEEIHLDGLRQTLWPDHCVQGTHGAELHPDLNAARIARVVQKGADPKVDSYSAFFDNAERHRTELDEFLRSRNVRELVVMGLATDYCVRATVVDAARLGYRVAVAVDGCRAIANPELALREMRATGAAIRSSDQLDSAFLSTFPAART